MGVVLGLIQRVAEMATVAHGGKGALELGAALDAELDLLESVVAVEQVAIARAAHQEGARQGGHRNGAASPHEEGAEGEAAGV